MTYYSDLTKYPKLFQTCYWGRFRVSVNPVEAEIIEARNRFVERFQLNGCRQGKMPQWVTNESRHLEFQSDQLNLDHGECYRSF